MRKWGYAGVVGVIVAAVLAGPVLAFWEWNAGDVCIWIDGCHPTLGAILVQDTGITAMEVDFSDSGVLHLSTDCTMLTVSIQDSETNEVFYDTWPFNEVVTVNPGYMIVFASNTPFDCYVSSVAIGEEPTPTPTPAPTPAPTPTPAAVPAGGLLDGFSATGIFATANDVVAAMLNVVFILGGIALGFTLGFTVLSFVLKVIKIK